jgi:hypothetical protein
MRFAKAPALACCLSPGDYQQRLAWIEALTRKALRSFARDDLVLRLFYAPEAVADVQTMIEQERICCAFLAFDIDQRTDAVRVTITAPEAARASADMLFKPFLAASGLEAPCPSSALPTRSDKAAEAEA